jgi:uncharacterized integral membrane protein
MRYLSALLTLIVAFVLVLFATSNREEASLDIFSFWQITAPLYIITFLVLLAGFLFGGFVVWNAGRRRRRLARQALKRAQTLEADLAAMHDRAQLAEDRLAEATAAAAMVAPAEPDALL